MLQCCTLIIRGLWHARVASTSKGHSILPNTVRESGGGHGIQNTYRKSPYLKLLHIPVNEMKPLLGNLIRPRRGPSFESL